MGSSPKKSNAKSKAASTEPNVVDVAAETAALDAAIAAAAAASNNGVTLANTSTKKSSSTAAAVSSKPKTAPTTSSAASWWYEAGWGAVMLYGLYVAATTAYHIRLGAINEYGPVIHEFDPYFNYRATEVSVLDKP
jgi:asparagine N-glycosylation enzyme membrane subunit Stt3